MQIEMLARAREYLNLKWYEKKSKNKKQFQRTFSMKTTS